MNIAAKPARNRTRGLEDKVFAIDRAGKRTFEDEAVFRAGRETEFVAKIREHNQAVEFVIAIRPLAQNVKSEVHFGAGMLAEHCGGRAAVGFAAAGCR